MDIEIIWSEYQSNLKAFLHSKVANPDDVDDLLQEILLKSYQSLSTVKDIKKVKSWLFQLAHNTIVDYYRKRGKSAVIANDKLWYGEEGEQILQKLSQCVIPFINALPDEEAKLLSAIEIEGMSQKQFAQQHKLKYSTLKSRVQKSRKMLLQLFNNCCELSVDQQGKLINFQEKTKGCNNC